MNKVIITGNLARDPEAFTTQSGISRSTFTVAVQRRFANAQGVREADFLTVVAWRGTADFCNRHLTKGRKVAVEGSLQTRSYNAQDGSKRYVVEIIADNVETLDKRQEGEQRPADAPQEPPKQQRMVLQPGPGGEFVEVDDPDDLPF